MAKKTISPKIRIKGEIFDFFSVVGATNVVAGDGAGGEDCGSG